MYESLFVSLSLITLVTFLCVSKKLYTFENILLWLIIVFVLTTYSDILALNYTHISFPENVRQVLTIRVLELSVYPIVIITYINLIQFSLNNLSKIGLNIFTVIILVSLEYFLEHLGFFKYRNWTLLNSFIFWEILIFISYLCQRGFRKILLREVKS